MALRIRGYVRQYSNKPAALFAQMQRKGRYPSGLRPQGWRRNAGIRCGVSIGEPKTKDKRRRS